MLRIIMHGTSQHLLYIVDLSCQVHAACIMIYCFHAQTQKPQFLTLFLAFATRRIPVKGIDDTKFIAGAVYITSILLAVIIVSTYTMKDLVNWGAVCVLHWHYNCDHCYPQPGVCAKGSQYMETESISYIVLH